MTASHSLISSGLPPKPNRVGCFSNVPVPIDGSGGQAVISIGQVHKHSALHPSVDIRQPRHTADPDEPEQTHAVAVAEAQCERKPVHPQRPMPACRPGVR